MTDLWSGGIGSALQGLKIGGGVSQWRRILSGGEFQREIDWWRIVYRKVKKSESPGPRGGEEKI